MRGWDVIMLGFFLLSVSGEDYHHDKLVFLVLVYADADVVEVWVHELFSVFCVKG
jgi:hypothetical protein